MAVAGAQAIVFHGFRIGDAFGQRCVGALDYSCVAPISNRSGALDGIAKESRKGVGQWLLVTLLKEIRKRSHILAGFDRFQRADYAELPRGCSSSRLGSVPNICRLD